MSRAPLLAQKVVRKVLRAVANYDPAYYDMYADADEAFFGRLYLARIRQHLTEAGITPPASVLDAGCQTGRLAIPMAQWGYGVTGIDTSMFALRRARRHAAQAGVRVAWHRADIGDALARAPHVRFDAVVCAEVMYLHRGYRAMLEAMARVLRPGGLLFVSHRTKIYFLIESMRHRDHRSAARVLEETEGTFEGPYPERGWYNWQTERELRSVYDSLGLRCLALHPIDRFGWLTGVRPSQLTGEEQEAWVRLELTTPSDLASSGRYVLAVTTPAPPA